MSEHIIRQIPRPSPEMVVTPRKPVEPSALTAEHLRSVLHYEPETGIFTRKVRTANSVKVGDIAGGPDSDGYLRIKVQSRKYQAHRLAWLYVYGVWPKDQLDHVNRVRTDNRISNLREATVKQNNQNKSKSSNNTSGHSGVSWYKRDSKWQAQITHNQKQIHLGYFNILEEAVAARKAAEKLYWADTQSRLI